MWVRRKSSSVLTLFSLALVLPTRAQLQERPNIIFVLVDDWGELGSSRCPSYYLCYFDLWVRPTYNTGWNDVGYHNPEILTPHMNMLAATGVRLERNYVAAVCTPSRAALMTGMYPHKIGRQVPGGKGLGFSAPPLKKTWTPHFTTLVCYWGRFF